MSDSSAMRRAARLAGALICLLAAGCAGRDRAPPQPPAPAAVPVETEAAPVAAAEMPQPAATPAPPAPIEPVPPVTPVAVPRAPAPAPAKRPATVAATPAPAPQAPKAPPAPVASKPSAPPLNLASLETRLRETRAIGVFTKISLKNQVDDLLGRFRAFYKGQAKTTLAELRRPYDMLLLKVLSLLQDSDPPLAHDIVASREAIWGILADPQKFTESNLMAGETP